MDKKRVKYHSQIAWLYNQEKENLLPMDFRKTIPTSTISEWRSSSFESYYGYEYVTVSRQELSYDELLQQNKCLKKRLRTITKSWFNVSNILLPVLQKNKEHDELFLGEIQRMINAFPKKMALKIMRISAQTFSYRMGNLHTKCGNSNINRCRRKYPHQLSFSEENKITSLFKDKKFKCWPSSSIYYRGLREHGLNICLGTFYKYVKALGLSTRNKKFDSNENYTGAVTYYPNEIMHVDTTFWRLPDIRKRAGIVFVSDNFSRMILGVNVAIGNHSKNVYNALSMTVDSIRKYHPDYTPTIELAADGGSENHAKIIVDLIENTTIPTFKKVIAKTDVTYSNSPIEAINKIAKRYLREYQPQTLEELERVVLKIIENYNNREHGSLNGLTPLESYTLTPPLDFKEQIKAERLIRKAENRQSFCLDCCV